MSHPDSEVLAEFRAGLITGRRGARISAHLATCEHCAGLCDSLAEVSVLLAAAPAAVMPDLVAQRLDGVLAAEVAHRHDSERAGGHSSQGREAGSRASRTGPGRQPGRHRNFRLVALRVLAPAAAAVLLAAGGYGLTRIGAAGPSSSAAAGSAASAPPEVPSPASASHAVALPAIEAPANLQVVISGTDYRRATLAQQLQHELQLSARKAAGTVQPAPASVKACELMVTSGISPGTLLLLETAHFQGQPAIVIVAVSGHQRVAWVVGSACSAAGEDLLAMTSLPGTSAA